MRRVLIILLAITVGVGMAFWYSAPNRSATPFAESEPVSDPTARAVSDRQTAVDPQPPPARQTVAVSVRDMVTDRLSAPSQAQIERYNELHILPWNPVVARDCSQADACIVVRRDPEHAYFSASDERLAEIRYRDPVAALVLARRALDDGSQLQNYIAAAALSGKPGPLLELAYGHYDDSESSDPAERQRRAVLEAVAARLGDERANPDAYSPGLTEDGVGLGSDASAARGVDAMLSSIEELRALAGLEPLLAKDGGW